MSRRGKPPTTTESERRGIQSVEVSAVILSALSDAGTSVPLRDLSESVNMPSSKVHRYLSSFIRTGLVAQDAGTGRYDLGPTALKLGLSALSRFDVIEIGHKAMKEMTDELNITSLLSVWGPQGPTIVKWQRAQQSLVTSLTIGSVMPLLSSASGRVFLSYTPKQLTANFVTRELAANRRSKSNAKLIKKSSEVQDLVSQTVLDGYASVDSLFVPGLSAIAAPILDSQSDAAAVITLIGTEHSDIMANTRAKKTLLGKCGSISLVA